MKKEPGYIPEQEEKKITGLYGLGVILVLVILTGLLAVFFAPDGGWQTGRNVPRITPSPTPLGEVISETMSVTPSPTPMEISIKQEFPETAVNLLVNGRYLFTLESREAAETLLQEYLNYWSSQPLAEGERLLKAYFEPTLALGKPDGTGELLEQGEAYARLIKNPSLLPVTRTTVSCRVETRMAESAVTTTNALPRGSRFIRSLGRPEFTLVYSETTYKGAAAYSQAETNRFLVGSGGAGYVAENGAYITADPSANAADKDWPAGRKPEKLRFKIPLTGRIQTYFGVSRGVMNYGLTYLTASEATVVAPEGGVIIYAAKRGNMGYVVDILHDEEGFVSRLWGLGSLRVELYERVTKGTAIGDAPNTGKEKAAITYEILVDDFPVNPIWYLK